MEQITKKKGIYDLLPKEIRNIKVSKGIRVTNSSYIDEEINLSDILEEIRSDKYKDLITTLRNISDEEKQKEYKQKILPYFVAATFKDKRRKNKALDSTQLMILDYDELGDTKNQKKSELKKHPNVLAVFDSPRNELKVICCFDKPITDHVLYSSLYKHYAKDFKANLGLNPDKTSDAARPCFFSYDTELYVNPEAKALSVDFIDFKKISQAQGSEKREENLKAISGVSKGNRNSNLVKFAGLLIDKGFDCEFVIELSLTWNKSNNPPLPVDEVINTIKTLYERNIETGAELPINYFIKNRSYYKKVEKKKDEFIDHMITSFTIEPKELLVLEDGDCLRCDVVSNRGQKYENILIENTDWHSKAKFLKAIGHSECNYFGSEQEIQAFCNFINSKVRNRKEGTRVIGLLKDTWVTKNINITKDGSLKEIIIVPVEKGLDSFHNKIEYKSLDESEYRNLIKVYYENILDINQQETILPWIGWNFASVVKPIIMDEIGGFPILFAHGTQGGGKTSTARMQMKQFGYTETSPKSCTMKPFPMLKLLSSTNAIAVILDEFKKSDMSEMEIEHMERIMRKIYSQETESKGRPDQTVIDYTLTAPLVVMGEWSVSLPALKERVILSSFTGWVKKNKSSQEAFYKINTLPLEGFMPKYIEFCLNQDIKHILIKTTSVVKRHFSKIEVAPRIINNLSVMLLGLVLFRRFGRSCGVKSENISLKELLDKQLESITGNKTGFVKSAVDQLIEELSVMAANAKIAEGVDYRILRVNHNSTTSVKILAIKFNKVFPEFKEWAQRKKYEGDLLGKEDYLKLFDDCEYIFDKSYGVKYPLEKKTTRSLCIDYNKALELGIDLDGFEVKETEN